MPRMSISKRVLEEIRFRNDIVEVIGAYFHLQRAGSAYKALCPFHKEKTPSFSVNPQRQIFHCFGCGAGGDVFRFVMQHDGVDFLGAARILAQRAGMRLELEEDGEDGAAKPALFALMGEAAALFHQTLKNSPAAETARRYLLSRDLPPDVWEQFQIGYAPDAWEHTLEWGRARGYSDEQMEACGLAVRRPPEEGRSDRDLYDRFRGRVMFPIMDEQGRTIGFSGRTLEKDAKGAKYVNSPETPLFKKSRVLYALDKARKAIVEAREAIACEGQIDVIRCHQAGFRTAVAAQGTAFTPEHVRILRRYADSVCLLFDSDTAGQNAAIRTAALFLEAGLAVRVAALPAGEDPDSFLRAKGAAAFQAVLDKAVSAVVFQVGVMEATQNLRSEVGKLRAARAVLQTIRASPNAVQRAALVQEAAARLNLPASALMDDLRHLMRTAARDAPAEGGPTGEDGAAKPAPARQHPPEEVALCEYAVHLPDFPQIGGLVREHLPLDLLTDPICRQLVAATLQADEEGRDLQNVLMEREDEAGDLQRMAAAALAAPLKTCGREFSPEDAVRKLIMRLWRRRLEREREELRGAENSDADPKTLVRRGQLTQYLNDFRRQDWDACAAIIALEK